MNRLFSKALNTILYSHQQCVRIPQLLHILVGSEFLNNSLVIVKQQALYWSETVLGPPQMKAVLPGTPVSCIEAGGHRDGLECSASG